MMKNKKISFAHFCAYLSLVISITMIVLWCCNVGGFSVVSLDSFVGVIVALLAIVVTLVLGWQIYSSIELKAKIEELSELKNKLTEQEKEIKQQTCASRHLVAASMSDFEISRSNYMMAFSYLMTSLKYSMALDKPLNVEKILTSMAISVSNIQQNAACTYTKDIRDSDIKIRESQCYNMIKSQYEKAYNDFFSKVKEDNHE